MKSRVGRTAVRRPAAWLLPGLMLGWLALGAAELRAQEPDAPFAPEVGRPGKDVVWVPSPDPLVDTMLEIADVTDRDVVMDLGSGDGRTVIAAARLGARAIGVEYDPQLVELSRAYAAAAGVAERATFVTADLFETDLSQATVVTMFLLPDLNARLRPQLLDLEPGTRVVSNTWDLEDWEADETVVLDPCPGFCTALLWIVPARVEGTWALPEGELVLEQQFQMVTGPLRRTPGRSRSRRPAARRGARLPGRRRRYAGRSAAMVHGTAASADGIRLAGRRCAQSANRGRQPAKLAL